jgi:cyclase
MLKKRIIPCLDVKNGRTVKGVNFKNLRDAGDAVDLAQHYAGAGADELVLLDISASEEKRATMAQFVKKVASVINIPFTIGGGISSVKDAELLLENGADKVSINSAALARPALISELAHCFGNQFVVLAADVKWSRPDGQWQLFSHGGKRAVKQNAMAWLREAEERGAGELLISAIDADGTKAGFNRALYQEIGTFSSLPLIASGGAGTKEHFWELFHDSPVDAALAASLFHFKELEIATLKTYLNEKKIPIRI